MRIALFRPFLENSASLSALNPGACFLQRVERHLKKIGHQISNFNHLDFSKDIFEFGEFIKVEDIEFTCGFGGIIALVQLSKQSLRWALFLTFEETAEIVKNLSGELISMLHSPCAIICDDFRAYQLLLERAWLIRSKIHYVRKAVPPVTPSPESQSFIFMPPEAKWFLINHEQIATPDDLLNSFVQWHRAEPNLFFVILNSDRNERSSQQIAKAVNQTGIVQLPDLSLPEHLAATKRALALLDMSRHPEESLTTLLGLELGVPLILREDSISNFKERAANQSSAEKIMGFGADLEILQHFQKLAEKKALKAKAKNKNAFRDFQREQNEYNKLFAHIS